MLNALVDVNHQIQHDHQLTCCNLVVILSDIVCFFTVASSSSIEAVACTPATEVLTNWSARASQEVHSALAFVQKSLPSQSIFSVECSLANVVFAEVSCQNGITSRKSHVTRDTSHFTNCTYLRPKNRLINFALHSFHFMLF